MDSTGPCPQAKIVANSPEPGIPLELLDSLYERDNADTFVEDGYTAEEIRWLLAGPEDLDGEDTLIERLFGDPDS